MTTPEKYRDRIFRAVVRYAEIDPHNSRARQDAYEDLMDVIDTVIKELIEPSSGFRQDQARETRTRT